MLSSRRRWSQARSGLLAATVEPPVFWVEAVGLWIIALHFFVHSTWKVRHPATDTEPADSDGDDPGELEAVELEDVDAAATGIISHQLRCGLRNGRRYFLNDNSSFRVPHTDQYRARVALFDRQGRRVYLGPFRDKGTANGYRTPLHTEAVWDDGRITRRALVLWQSVNGGSRWTHWVSCS